MWSLFFVGDGNLVKLKLSFDNNVYSKNIRLYLLSFSNQLKIKWADLIIFFENNVLIRKPLNTKLVSYDDLSSKIVRRKKDFMKKLVSSKNIDDFSFQNKGSSIKKSVDQDCPICLSPFEENATVCKLSCGHCFAQAA